MHFMKLKGECYTLCFGTTALRYDTTREVKKIYSHARSVHRRKPEKFLLGEKAGLFYKSKRCHRMNQQALDFRDEFDEMLISFDEKVFALLLR